VTDPTADELAQQLGNIRRRMAAAATDQPTPEQLADWKAFDKQMADRIHKTRPGIPLHHAYATLQTLRILQRMEAQTAEPTPAGRAPATDQTEFRDRIAAALLARIKRATVSRQQPYDAVTSLLAAPRLDKDPA
jgi:hypothetical protein